MSTLAERVAWILEHRRAPDGGRWNAKALSRAAELGDSHVGQIKRGDVTDVKADTLIAIARAAGVSSMWLITGKGEPTDPDAYEAHAPAPSPAPDVAEPRMGNLPAWERLVAAAKLLKPGLPAWCWAALANSHPLFTKQPTPAMIAELAELALKYGTPPAEGDEKG